MFMHLLCVYKKPIILSLFRINTLNFTMCILTILICPLKKYVIRLHNLISMNIIVKRKPKINKLKKPFKKSDFFKPIFNKHFLHNKGC